MQLRDYQKDLLSRVEDALDADTDARVMMQLPTGGGKDGDCRRAPEETAHRRPQSGLDDASQGTG